MKKEITYSQLKNYLTEMFERYAWDEVGVSKQEWEMKNGILWRMITNMVFKIGPGRQNQIDYITDNIEECIHYECEKEHVSKDIEEDLKKNYLKYCRFNSLKSQIDYTLDCMDL